MQTRVYCLVFFLQTSVPVAVNHKTSKNQSHNNFYAFLLMTLFQSICSLSLNIFLLWSSNHLLKKIPFHELYLALLHFSVGNNMLWFLLIYKANFSLSESVFVEPWLEAELVCKSFILEQYMCHFCLCKVFPHFQCFEYETRVGGPKSVLWFLTVFLMYFHMCIEEKLTVQRDMKYTQQCMEGNASDSIAQQYKRNKQKRVLRTTVLSV